MHDKNLKEITIKEIVEQADLNRGTFYKHYQYKEDLLEEIGDEVIADLIQSYREPYVNKETFVVSELSSSAIKIFEHVYHNAKFYTLIIQSNAIPGFQSRICNVLKKLSMYDLDDCYPNSKINNNLRASYQAYAILGMIIEWVTDGFKFSPTYMAEQLLEFINTSPVQGVFTRRDLSINE